MPQARRTWRPSGDLIDAPDRALRLGRRGRLVVGAVVLVAALMADVLPVSGRLAPGWRARAVGQGPFRPPTVADTQGSSPATPDSPAPVVAAISGPASLDARLAADGYEVPTGAGVYAVKVDGGGGSPLTYQTYEAGGGALTEDFWPASSIKVLVALGALDFARSIGFTGAATVAFDDGRDQTTIQAIYQAAIAESSNFDYDSLVLIAGVERLNSVFLTEAHGFGVTSVFQSYTGGDLSHSPGFTLTEGERYVYVPARNSVLDPKCGPVNCSNLLEMTESIRRVMLNDEIPPDQRFDIAPGDVAALQWALGHADGFFPEAVDAALGPGARIYDKPGDVADRDCLDVAYIVSPAQQRFLLATMVPHSSGGCDALTTLATGVLQILSR